LSWVVAEDKIKVLSVWRQRGQKHEVRSAPRRSIIEQVVVAGLGAPMDRSKPCRWAMQCYGTVGLRAFWRRTLKTRLPEGDHFYNRIDGQRYDFTEIQFSQPIRYADIPTTSSEAERGATSSELAALKAAFVRHSASPS
jgi:hypothetical protein